MDTHPHPPPPNKWLDTQLESKCFSGFGLTGWTDEFRFKVSLPPARIAEIVVNFYSQQSALLVQRTPELKFTRGNRFWSLFNLGPETWPFQTITVDLQQSSDNTTNVSITYDAKAFLAFRFPPFGLQKEVELLCLTLSTPVSHKT